MLLSFSNLLTEDKSNLPNTFQVFRVGGVLGLGHCWVLIICEKEVSILMLGLSLGYLFICFLVYNVKICVS